MCIKTINNKLSTHTRVHKILFIVCAVYTHDQHDGMSSDRQHTSPLVSKKMGPLSPPGYPVTLISCCLKLPSTLLSHARWRFELVKFWRGAYRHLFSVKIFFLFFHFDGIKKFSIFVHTDLAPLDFCMDKSVNRSMEVIPQSEELAKVMSGPYPLFGYGNERRDMTLLERGDLKILTPVDSTFFGCLDCGSRAHNIRVQNRRSYCSSCSSPRVYWVQGVTKGTMAELKVGYRDNSVRINRL